MQMIILDPTLDNMYELHTDKLNIIVSNKGKLILPMVNKLSWIKVLFTEEGPFYFDAQQVSVGIGSKFSQWVHVLPGQVGFDTQPSLVYVPSKNKWFFLGGGNILLYDHNTIQELKDENC